MTMPTPASNLIAIGLCLLMAFASNACATNKPVLDQCLLTSIKQSQTPLSYHTLKQDCQVKIEQQKTPTQAHFGAISQRLLDERENAYNPFVITPHKRNYILFASASNNINQAAYSDFPEWAENLSDIEAKFQLSIKVPLSFNTLLVEGDALFIGFTLQAWWQIYSDDISKPFRETNYQPEIFYLLPLNWHPREGNTALLFGLEHESNGRSQPLSRSWNRVYAELVFEKDNFVFGFKPWWRLPENEKADRLDADGDDNPDIANYLGHFELGMAHKWKQYEVALMTRRSFSHDRGAVELSFTFPLWGRLRGFAQYFNGYGESLIDYNYHQQRFGLGVALTGLL